MPVRQDDAGSVSLYPVLRTVYRLIMIVDARIISVAGLRRRVTY